MMDIMSAEFDTAFEAARVTAKMSDFDQHVIWDGESFTVADDRGLDFGEPVDAIKVASFEGRRHGDY